jgi:hypothetical protein
VLAAVVALINERPARVRVAIDGASAALPDALAERVVAAMNSRALLHVRADHFWRQAALRLENGREDPDTWLDGWLDAAALRREVLNDFPGSGRVLPALRDPATDRAVRVEPVVLPDYGVVIVSGAALLGRGLPFDAAVHLHLSTGALARRTAADQAWTLPALARYEAERHPDEVADLVIRSDDPRHPALLAGRPIGK